MTADESRPRQQANKANATLLDLTTAGIALVRSIESLRAYVAARENIGTTEMRALARVAEANRLTPKQLAASLGLTTGAVTAVADRLVTSGLLARSAHPTDRRSLHLELTSSGQKVIDRIGVTFRDAISDASRDATDEQIHETARLLQATAARVLEIAGNDGAR
ncbi:MAG: MarR family transcriptional regulator [Actinomycetota bacterium]